MNPQITLSFALIEAKSGYLLAATQSKKTCQLLRAKLKASNAYEDGELHIVQVEINATTYLDEV